MHNQFRDIVQFYEKINMNTMILSDKEIYHQKKRLKDLNELMKEFSLCAEKLESADMGIESREKITDMLLELHTILARFEWYIAHMQDLCMDVVKGFDDAKE